MFNTLTQNWWLLAVRGLLAILFGIFAFIWPGLTLTALVLVFGAYAFVDGVAALVTAFRRHQAHKRWWPLLIEGIIGIAAGVVTVLVPGITAIALVYLIAVWALLTGVTEIVAAIQLRKEIQGEWFLILSGILSIIFGIVIMLFPGAGALSLVWIIGSYAIVFGVVFIMLSFRMRGSRGSHKPMPA